MDNTKKLPTVLSLCTGYGGIEKGLEKAIGKITPVAHVEIEAFAITNLVNKMETGKLVPVPIWTNLKTFRPRIFRNKVDILTGGYPCQPFSAAGKRKGQKDPRHLWPWIRSAIKVIKPKMCFFENVEGHVSLGLREVLTDLVKLGYSVENDCGQPTWGLFSAAEVGAPHQRKRVFILAYSDDFRPWNINNPLRCEAGTEILRQRDVSERSIRTDPTSPNSELAYSEHLPGCSKQRIEHKECSKEFSRGFELANPRLLGQEKPEQQTAGVEQCCEELAHSGGKGCEGVQFSRNDEGTPEGGAQSLSVPAPKRCSHEWPARPGQPQYEWEEPRTVADTLQYVKPQKRGSADGREQESTVEIGKSNRGRNKPETKSQLGRAINGTQDRVDRLRLLGNGVVPQTAEIAFWTLYDRIINPVKIQPSIQLEMF